MRKVGKFKKEAGGFLPTPTGIVETRHHDFDHTASRAGALQSCFLSNVTK